MLQSQWIQEQMDHEFNAQFDDHRERYHSSFEESRMEAEIQEDYEKECILEWQKETGIFGHEPQEVPNETPIFEDYEDDGIPF